MLIYNVEILCSLITCHFLTRFACYFEVSVLLQFYHWLTLIFPSLNLMVIHYHTQRENKTKFNASVKLQLHS